MYYIYKITCIPNNKIYIGYTGNTIEIRWKQHLDSAFHKNKSDYNALFKRAIRKYGKENFKKEEIEQCETLEEAKEREVHWINFYHSYAFEENGWGYNSTRGGDGVVGFNEIPVAMCDIISGKLIKVYNSVIEATRDNCKGVVECCANPTKNKSANGFCLFI